MIDIIETKNNQEDNVPVPGLRGVKDNNIILLLVKILKGHILF